MGLLFETLGCLPIFRCVKFEESNDLQRLVFGAVSVIPAKDAVPVEVSDMFDQGLWKSDKSEERAGGILS